MMETAGATGCETPLFPRGLNTSCSLTRATRPCRAARNASGSPAIPPPTTKASYDLTGRARAARRHLPESRLHPHQDDDRLGEGRPAGAAGRRVRGARQCTVGGSRCGRGRKDGVVRPIREGAYRDAARSAQIDLLEGEGRFVGGRRFRVGDTELQARRIFLNAGTRDVHPAIDGLDGVPFLTSRSILDLRELPEHLLVVGGGYIGCEFAQMFRRFGSRVTLVQRADRLLTAEDPDLSAVVLEAFAAEDIQVLTATACMSFSGTDRRIRITCEGPEATEIEGSDLLIAAGRTPNTDALALDQIDVAADGRGYMAVDDQLRTAVEDVWALGDVRGGPMFTHTARDDADVVYRNVYLGQDRSNAARIVPHAVFVDPEVASVGMTDQQALDAGHEVALGVQQFAGVVRARAIGETRGLTKFVVDNDSDRILGCHIAGPGAGELIHEAVIAMVARASYADARRAIHVHPTLSEGINSAAGGVHRETGT